MIVTSKHFIPPEHKYFDECKFLCNRTAELRNTCLEYIRALYFSTDSLKDDNSWSFNNTHLYHKFKEHPNHRTDKNPEVNRLVPTKVFKQTFIHVNREFGSYLQATKSYYKNPSKFNGKPNIPNYTKHSYMTTFPKEAISFKKLGYMKLSMTSIEIPLGELKKYQIKEITIVPQSHGYHILVKYEIPDVDVPKIPECITFAGLDLGGKNTCALASNDPDINPIVINGGPAKSISQFYHKEKRKMRNALPKGTKGQSGLKTSKRIRQLGQKERHKMDNLLHHVSNEVINWLLENGIQCLVLGYNQGWKNEIDMGKINNQNFYSIPFYRLKQMLEYKCELNGILLITTEESYTSKCSFLDLEPMCHQVKYLGNRKTRGMFTSSNGTKMNADINAAYNILRKVIGDTGFQSTDRYENLMVGNATIGGFHPKSEHSRGHKAVCPVRDQNLTNSTDLFI